MKFSRMGHVANLEPLFQANASTVNFLTANRTSSFRFTRSPTFREFTDDFGFSLVRISLYFRCNPIRLDQQIAYAYSTVLLFCTTWVASCD